MCVILTIGVWEMYLTSRFVGLALQVIISLAAVRELARWIKSYSAVGYSSEKESAILPVELSAGLIVTTRSVLQEKILWWLCDKSFFMQDCSVKTAEYWLRSFFLFLFFLGGGVFLFITGPPKYDQFQPSWPPARVWWIYNSYLFLTFQFMLQHCYTTTISFLC